MWCRHTLDRRRPEDIGRGTGPGLPRTAEVQSSGLCRKRGAWAPLRVYRRAVEPRTRLSAIAARLRTTPSDLLLAVAVTGLVVTELDGGAMRYPTAATALAVPILISLAWRRRWPVVVVVAVSLLDVGLSAASTGPFPPQLMFVAVLLAVYSAAAHTAGRHALVAGATSLVLITVAHNLTGDGDPGDFLPQLVWGAPWLAGRLVRRQTIAAAESATRAAEVLRLRDEQVREARDRERDRIARELHDVVAHAVSLMVVQAGAERLRLGHEAPHTREVLEAVETNGRQALSDLRGMLGVLRDADAPEGLAPQPRLSDLTALVERVRAAGLPVELDVAAAETVPDALGLAAYRIAQEALTNVLKHAGPVPTRVRVRTDGERVRLDVVSALPAGVPAQRSADGRGLLGMQERAALHGGQVRCGPEDGRWAVHAELPLATA